MKKAADRRSKPVHRASARVSTPAGISPAQACILVVFGLVVTGTLDWATDREAWFGPVYLLLIGFASWSLGWREAVAVGLVCLTTSLSLNGLTLFPYGTEAALWNLGARLGAVGLTIGLLEMVRKSHAMQWRMARTDLLTGALNRQAFFESLPNARSSNWRMLAYLDLDGFKKLNDEHGHAAGDESLKRFARSVKKLIRSTDVFARIGGDEFLIYLSVKDEAAAKLVATRLHLAINSTSNVPNLGLSCSIGVLILPPGNRELDTEVRLADQLMYEAKQEGASIAVATMAIGDSTLRHSELRHSFADRSGAPPARGKDRDGRSNADKAAA